ncbi:Beta-1,3-galactosyltransferase sqv-2 [Zea mays]|uniref:Beta-1,3-galactosyltransferase sqv-2 n=1 Tax=Zea mays TaxID=4577 RepID=A0A1D6QSM2_MAIZE|nr:Beta-1,3-galactosyltransferase sqv-2 [Zea mays]
MSWRRGGSGGDGGVSRRWAVLLCVGSFCLGLLFTNRMWTLPEASEIARPNANVEEGTVPIAAECGSKKVGCFFLPLPIPPRIPKANPQFDPCLPVGAIKSSPFWSIQCHA